ncbi:Regulator of nitric oxide reductase transcription [Hahella chejuensis KCTC 2396]|uniref:Regulator of nitric oxide reductase transcription n=1 Tax=Hahella chejuensis (strain KCTC 2396) TaxID=349521 RepID=Q2SGT5_HAHCH|nr:NosR/NirI family protein [Hahella chejuensis]ABC30139.1 Regulator of nitric oxide reductase transcription [Hahella chejuensis KCTC 2396]
MESSFKGCLRWVFLTVLLLLTPTWGYAEEGLTAIEAQRINEIFPQADVISDPLGDPPVRTISLGNHTLGYAYQTHDVFQIPAYSGKPINLHIILDAEGTIKDAVVLEHHEPILLVGIPEQKLFDFVAGYQEVGANDRVVVGHSDSATKSVDAITGATVTVMVVNESIMRSVRKVATSLGLINANATAPIRAEVLEDLFNTADWAQLTGAGAIRRLHLSRGQVDESFRGTAAEGVDDAPPDSRDETFINLYYAYLNAPTIGRNLLGESQYRWLMEELKPGEHAIAVMAEGRYSFKGSGYVRGGIFDRVQLRQRGDIISFRDLDYYRLSDVYAQGMPEFREMAIFVIRSHYDFDPGGSWELELLVRRQTGPVEGVFSSFSASYQIPDAYVSRPAPLVVDEPDPEPIWISIWRNKSMQIGVVIVSLALLLVILFLQDYFVRFPRLLHHLRRIYLLYTVVFLGWYALGQLSIVNVLTFTHAVMQDFHWELFLIDPVIFILWTFTAATILLWGRGVFCGWLCPFGALQELINEAARKIKIPQFDLPFGLHERLWAVKYIILLALFGVSLESMATAEKYAEVEPFKTSITLLFNREWWFVAYAGVLLLINVFTRKFYCRYLCPLGAALAIPTKFRLFDWLKRRKECGNPCQLCAVECEIQAIHPDGRINANECHHCLDCQMTYHNERKCPPLVLKNKRQRKNAAAPRPERIPATQLDG